MSKMIDLLNKHAPPSLKTLGGVITSFDEESGVIEIQYEAIEAFTHSNDIIQGGYIAGMLDAAMAHVVFCVLDKVIIVATLEIKVSYLNIARPGTLRATGRVLRMGKSVGFLEAEIFDADNEILAKASSTVRIVDQAPRGLDIN